VKDWIVVLALLDKLLLIITVQIFRVFSSACTFLCFLQRVLVDFCYFIGKGSLMDCCTELNLLLKNGLYCLGLLDRLSDVRLFNCSF
jgi:hypothetical protein